MNFWVNSWTAPSTDARDVNSLPQKVELTDFCHQTNAAVNVSSVHVSSLLNGNPSLHYIARNNDCIPPPGSYNVYYFKLATVEPKLMRVWETVVVISNETLQNVQDFTFYFLVIFNAKYSLEIVIAYTDEWICYIMQALQNFTITLLFRGLKLPFILVARNTSAFFTAGYSDEDLHNSHTKHIYTYIHSI